MALALLAVLANTARAQSVPIEDRFEGPDPVPPPPPPIARSFESPEDPLLVPTFDGEVPAACEEGRVRTEGRCCWPAQTFSVESGRCEGVPQCPIGLVEHGETCVAPAFTPLPAPGEGYGDVAPPGYPEPSLSSRISPTASARDWSSVDELGASAPTHRVDVVRGEDEALVTLSFAMFDVGWVFGWLVPLLDDTTGSCTDGDWSSTTRTSCQSWPFAFLPVVGGIVSGLTEFGSGWRQQSVWGVTFGSVSLVLQVAGIIAVGISLGNETTEARYTPLDEPEETADVEGYERFTETTRSGPSFGLRPEAGGADVGLSLVGSF